MPAPGAGRRRRRRRQCCTRRVRCGPAMSPRCPPPMPPMPMWAKVSFEFAPGLPAAASTPAGITCGKPSAVPAAVAAPMVFKKLRRGMLPLDLFIVLTLLLRSESTWAGRTACRRHSDRYLNPWQDQVQRLSLSIIPYLFPVKELRSWMLGGIRPRIAMRCPPREPSPGRCRVRQVFLAAISVACATACGEPQLRTACRKPLAALPSASSAGFLGDSPAGHRPKVGRGTQEQR